MSAAASPVRAVLAACLGIALFAGMDGVMKGLAIAIGAYSAMVWRTGAGIVVAGGVWALSRPRRPAAVTLRLHVLRGVVTAAMAVSFFWGLARTPMAQAIALTFVAPLIALFLARVLLGETIGRGAVIGTGIALAGVGVILSGAGIDGGGEWTGTAAILFSALCYAWNIILQRQQALAASPAEIAFFQSLVMCGVLLLAAPAIGVERATGHWPAVWGAAVLATVSLHLLAWAYARAEANRLVPVEYTAFVWAAVIGWVAFGEPLRRATLAGAVLIVAGCLYATRRRESSPVSIAEAQL